MPGSPPAGNRIIIYVRFFSMAFILMKAELLRTAEKQQLLLFVMRSDTHCTVYAGIFKAVLRP